MLKGFFGGVSSQGGPTDQTTPKASDQRNPFDLLTPSSRRTSTTNTGTSSSSRMSYSGSTTPSSSDQSGLITPGASVPGTPGGRALPTTGQSLPTLTVLSKRAQGASRGSEFETNGERAETRARGSFSRLFSLLSLSLSPLAITCN